MGNSPIELSGIIEAARRKAGQVDLGETQFMRGLEAFIKSLNEDVVFSSAGREAMVDRLVRILVNRLRFTTDLKANPEILDQTLLPPLVILGLPRVGSTKLHRMLASSKSFQDLLFWQVLNPARMDGSDGGAAARVADAENYVAWRMSTNQAANAAHRIAVHEVEEESFLLEYSFETMYPMAFVDAVSYYQWIGSRDRYYTYEYLAFLLKYLQWQFFRRQKKPWILKSPPNLGFEAQITRAMPGARFIMLHRDPVTIVASVAALVKQSRMLYGEKADAGAIGRWCLNEFSSAIKRHIAWRRANPNALVLDLSYRDIEANALLTARKAYGFLGLPLNQAVSNSIEAWLAGDQHGTTMKHEYALQDCGLAVEEILGKFADYVSMFGNYL